MTTSLTPPLIVTSYSPLWPKQFEEEAQKIKTILGDNCLTIHHIGSTAIPGLAAKPIIDMIPVVKDILAVDQCNTQMIALGYEPRGEYGMMFRRFFCKGSPIRSYNVHVFEHGNEEIKRHLLFRDYLIVHPAAQKAYSKLKQKLAQLYPNDIEAYCMGKDAFVQVIDAQTGFDGCRIVQALTPQQWSTYHRIRREQIFDPMGVVYDPQHPTINAPNHFHFIFIKGTQIIGVCHVELLDDKRAAIRPFAIDTPYQNQGLGTRFLKAVERWINHQGRINIHLHAHPKAFTFYQRAGFKQMPFEDTESCALAGNIDMGKILRSLP